MEEGELYATILRNFKHKFIRPRRRSRYRACFNSLLQKRFTLQDCDCPGASRLNYVIPFSRPGGGLNQSSFGEGKGGAAGHDKMVQDLDVYQGQCLLERLRQHFVGMAGLGYTGWVVVRENHRGSVAR